MISLPPPHQYPQQLNNRSFGSKKKKKSKNKKGKSNKGKQRFDPDDNRGKQRLHPAAKMKRILSYCDFWFSKHNLMTDDFLRHEIKKHHGYVPIQKLLTFSKFRDWTNAQLLVDAFHSSAADRYSVKFDPQLWIPPPDMTPFPSQDDDDVFDEDWHESEDEYENESEDEYEDESENESGEEDEEDENNSIQDSRRERTSRLLESDTAAGSDIDNCSCHIQSLRSESATKLLSLVDDKNGHDNQHHDRNNRLVGNVNEVPTLEMNGSIVNTVMETSDTQDVVPSVAVSKHVVGRDHRNDDKRNDILVDTSPAPNDSSHIHDDRRNNVPHHRTAAINEDNDGGQPISIEPTRMLFPQPNENGLDRTVAALVAEDSNDDDDDDEEEEEEWRDFDFDDNIDNGKYSGDSGDDLDGNDDLGTKCNVNNKNVPQISGNVDVGDMKDLRNAFVRHRRVTLEYIAMIEQEIYQKDSSDNDFDSDECDCRPMDNDFDSHEFYCGEYMPDVEGSYPHQGGPSAKTEQKHKIYGTSRPVSLITTPSKLRSFCDELLQSAQENLINHNHEPNAYAIGMDVEYCSLEMDIRPTLPAMIQLCGPNKKTGPLGLIWIHKFPDHGRDLLTNTREYEPLIKIFTDTKLFKVGVSLSRDTVNVARWCGIAEKQDVAHFFSGIVNLEEVQNNENVRKKSLQEMATLVLQRNLPKIKGKRRTLKDRIRRAPTAHWRTDKITGLMKLYAANDVACAMDVWMHINNFTSSKAINRRQKEEATDS